MKGRQYAERDPAIHRLVQLANRQFGAVWCLLAGDIDLFTGSLGARLECHDFFRHAAAPRIASRTHAAGPTGTPLDTGFLGLEWRGLCVGTRSLGCCARGLQLRSASMAREFAWLGSETWRLAPQRARL